MVIYAPPLIILSLNQSMPRYGAFWIACLLGLIQDLLTLSLPIGFFAFLFSIMSLLWSFAKNYFPPFTISFSTLPAVFIFCFSFSLAESILLSTFHHWIEDLLLAPLINTGLFAILVLLVKWWKTPKTGPA